MRGAEHQDFPGQDRHFDAGLRVAADALAGTPSSAAGSTALNAPYRPPMIAGVSLAVASGALGVTVLAGTLGMLAFKWPPQLPALVCQPVSRFLPGR